MSQRRSDAAEDTYYTARQIESVLSGMLPEMPGEFRRSDAATKLGKLSPREVKLLTDALLTMSAKGLVELIKPGNSWRNNVR